MTGIEFLVSMAALTLVLGFASYAISRLLVKEAIIEEWRDRLIVGLAFDKSGRPVKSGVRVKLLKLISCTICMGFWVSLGLVLLTATQVHLSLFAMGLLVASSWGVEKALAVAEFHRVGDETHG